jgi:DNA-binding transcriptional LysR family regulator
MRYLLVASPEYIAKHGAPLTPEALPEHQCIYLGYARFRENWTLQRGQKKVVVKVPTRMTINNSSAILSAVLADGGIGLVPDFTARHALMEGAVMQVLGDWELMEPYTGAAYAVYQPGKHLALKIRAFIDFLVAV